MKNIIKFRKEKNLSQKELAKLVNISPGYLSHLENGGRKNPSIVILKKIAEILEKDISDLLR
ncbi:MAG: helix-turn-helix transcriptional regulator [Clostridiales bacterium]|nr:helix-turn-helix transcriptional regulator [Clostridiales bacterium]